MLPHLNLKLGRKVNNLQTSVCLMHAYIAFSVLNVVKVLADTFNKENKEYGEGPSGGLL